MMDSNKAEKFALKVSKLRTEGYTDDQINTAIKRDGNKFTIKDIEDVASSWTNVGRTLLQGISLNYGDEMIAGARSTFGDTPYDKALKEERQGVAAYSAMNPYKSMGLEVAGALPTAFVPGLGQARAATFGGRLAKAASQGGAEGFVAGTGRGTEGNRLESGTAGAGGGMVGGTLMKGGTELVGDAASRLFAKGLGRSSEQQTAREAARQIADNGEGVNAALERANTVTPNRAKDMVIGDLSEDLSISTSALANRGQPGRNASRNALRDREANAGDRIMSTVRGLMTGGTKLKDNFIEEGLALTSQMKEAADPLYRVAKRTVSLEPIRDQLEIWSKHPVIKKASIEAKSLVEIGETFDPKSTSLKTWDLIKQGLDSVYEKNLKGDGSPNKVAAHAQRLKTDLLELLDSDMVDPDRLYAKARAAYSGPASIKSALDNGYDFFRTASAKKAAVGRNAINNMSAGERDAFARGIAYSIKDMAIEAGDTANIARNITKGPRADALKALFPNEIEHGKFIREITDELSMFETSGVALRGSRTTALDEALSAIDNKIGLGGSFSGDGVVSLIMNKIKGDATELSKNKVYKHLSDILMTKLDDPAKVKKILQADLIDKVYDGVKSATSATLEKAGRRVGASTGDAFLKPLVIDVYNTPTGAPRR